MRAARRRWASELAAAFLLGQRAADHNHNPADLEAIDDLESTVESYAAGMDRQDTVIDNLLLGLERSGIDTGLYYRSDVRLRTEEDQSNG